MEVYYVSGAAIYIKNEEEKWVMLNGDSIISKLELVQFIFMFAK